MEVLFLKVRDLEMGEYLRQGKKNLLKTKWGKGDTIALSGKLVRVEKTKYGPRLWIDDSEKIGVVTGTFNEKVRKNAQEILKNFKKEKNIYLLIYGNPYYRGKLYINVNQDNGVLVVEKGTYQKFHQMRERSRVYLEGGEKERKEVKEKKEITYEDIFNFLKKRETKKATIEEIEENFSGTNKEEVYEKILELLELGRAYEPKAGMIELLD